MTESDARPRQLLTAGPIIGPRDSLIGYWLCRAGDTISPRLPPSRRNHQLPRVQTLFPVPLLIPPAVAVDAVVAFLTSFYPCVRSLLLYGAAPANPPSSCSPLPTCSPRSAVPSQCQPPPIAAELLPSRTRTDFHLSLNSLNPNPPARRELPFIPSGQLTIIYSTRRNRSLLTPEQAMDPSIPSFINYPIMGLPHGNPH